MRHKNSAPLPVDGTVRSGDGALIAYRTVGSGAAIVVVPGVLSVAEDYDSLARALAEHFTVHTIQRRGRGRSADQDEGYDISQECQDLDALCARTGARYLVGHSYGGLIALQAARNNPALTKIAVYEPGVFLDGMSTTWMPGYRERLARGRRLDALAHFSVATGPDRARGVPVWMMKLILLLVLPPRRRRTMYGLLGVNLREHQQIARLNRNGDEYREVGAPVLLMSGAKSGLSFVQPAIQRLGQLLPESQTRQFPELDHFGPDRTGPRQVADALVEYFQDG
jgi:pimeloyl-ACP methyl ester carboxylesterase